MRSCSPKRWARSVNFPLLPWMVTKVSNSVGRIESMHDLPNKCDHCRVVREHVGFLRTSLLTPSLLKTLNRLYKGICGMEVSLLVKAVTKVKGNVSHQNTSNFSRDA